MYCNVCCMNNHKANRSGQCKQLRGQGVRRIHTLWQKQDALKSTPRGLGSCRKLRKEASPQYTVCTAIKKLNCPFTMANRTSLENNPTFCSFQIPSNSVLEGVIGTRNIASAIHPRQSGPDESY